eukprot:11017643-Ditylum_brightwellii.AAC.1
MTENVSQARAVTEFARNYLNHVNHAMMTVNVLQANAIVLTTAPRDGAKEFLTGNVRLRRAQENRVMKTQTVNRAIAPGRGH